MAHLSLADLIGLLGCTGMGTPADSKAPIGLQNFPERPSLATRQVSPLSHCKNICIDVYSWRQYIPDKRVPFVVRQCGKP